MRTGSSHTSAHQNRVILDRYIVPVSPYWAHDGSQEEAHWYGVVRRQYGLFTEALRTLRKPMPGDIPGRKKSVAIADHHPNNAPLRNTMSFPSFKIPARRRPLFFAALASCLTFLVYLPTLRNGFVNWDDYAYIVDNSHIRSLSWSNLKWLLTDTSIDYWHPLSMLSHALDYALWGANPVGHHLTSILLHAANTFLVVILCVSLLTAAKRPVAQSVPKGSGDVPGRFADQRGILLTAVTTGLLFGLHPLHVESVAWVTERKDQLSGFFFLLSLMAYGSYVTARAKTSRAGTAYYAATLLFSLLALASKAMAVTLPAIFLLLDWYPFRRIRSWRELARMTIEKSPFILLSLTLSAMTFAAHTASGVVVPYTSIPLPDRVFIAFRALGMYLWKMAVPANLVVFYYYPRNISLLSPEILSAVLLVASITAICFLIAKRHPWPLLLWAYYVITLFPVLGIIQVSGSSMADRFTYLPSLGPFLAAGLLAARVFTWSSSAVARPNLRGIVVAAAALVLVSLLAYLTIRQIAVWKNGITLWSHTIERTEQPVAIAYLDRGVALEEDGQFDRALQDLSQAISLAPTDAECYKERGILFGKMGRYDRAVADLDTAIELKPSDAASYDYRGIALEYLGQLDRALADYDRAIALRPDASTFYRNRGIALGKAGRLFAAIGDLTRSIALAPAVEAYVTRGGLYLRSRDTARAMLDYQTACTLGSTEACDALAAFGSR